MARYLITAALLATLGGCAGKVSGPQEMTIIPGVPGFSGQLRTDDCGAVALSSLLAHAGYQVSPRTIDAEIYDPVIKGSLLLDMETYLAALGARPRSGRGDLKLLRTRLEQQRPVLLPLDLGWGGWRRPHYVLVFGYAEDSFLMHERQGKTLILANSELEKRWQKTGFLYLYLE